MYIMCLPREPGTHWSHPCANSKVQMAQFQLVSFLAGLVSNWAQL